MHNTSNNLVDEVIRQVGPATDDDQIGVKIVDGKPVLARGYGQYRGGVFFMDTNGELRIGGRSSEGGNSVLIPGVQRNSLMSKLARVSIDYTSGVKDFGYRDGSGYFVLMNNGTLYVWGANHNGSSAIGATAPNPIIRPTIIEGIWDEVVIPEAYSYNTSSSAMYLRKRGEKDWYFVGANAWGCYSIGTLVGDTQPIPTIIPHPEGETIKKMWLTTQADGNVFALTEEGNLWAVGRNFQGSLGIGNTTENIKEWTKVQGLPLPLTANQMLELEVHGTAGYSNPKSQAWNPVTLVRIGQDLYTTGPTAHGMNGQNGVDVNVFTQLQGIPSVKSVSHPQSSLQPYVVLTNNNEFYSWGFNESGCFGTGDYVNLNVPTLIHEDVDAVWDYRPSGTYGYRQTFIIRLKDGSYWYSGEQGRGSLYPKVPANYPGRITTFTETRWQEFEHITGKRIVHFHIISEWAVLENRSILAFMDDGSIYALGFGNPLSSTLTDFGLDKYDVEIHEPTRYF